MLTSVTIVILIAGSLLLIAGLIILSTEWTAERELRKTVKETNEDMKQPQKDRKPDSPIEAQGGIDTAVNSVANLAKALKDLNSSNRVLVLSLALYVIAAVAALSDAVTGA